MLFPPTVARREGSIGTIGITSPEVIVAVVAALGAYAETAPLLFTRR